MGDGGGRGVMERGVWQGEGEGCGSVVGEGCGRGVW